MSDENSEKSEKSVKPARIAKSQAIGLGIILACLIVGVALVWTVFSGSPSQRQVVVDPYAAPPRPPRPTSRPATTRAATTMPNQDKLFTAVEKGDVKLVEDLLGENPKLALAYDTSGATALHGAAWIGNIPIARMLLDDGALMEVVELRHGGTPLEWAVVAGKKDMVEFLLGRGARVTDDILVTAVDGSKGQFVSFAKTPRDVYPQISKLLLKRAATMPAQKK